MSELNGSEPVRLIPEPDNKFDANAIAVHVASKGAILHCGYVPKELAKEIAPLLEGESLDCKIDAITGGFLTSDDEIAYLGLRLIVQIPDTQVVKQESK